MTSPPPGMSHSNAPASIGLGHSSLKAVPTSCANLRREALWKSPSYSRRVLSAVPCGECHAIPRHPKRPISGGVDDLPYLSWRPLSRRRTPCTTSTTRCAPSRRDNHASPLETPTRPGRPLTRSKELAFETSYTSSAAFAPRKKPDPSAPCENRSCPAVSHTWLGARTRFPIRHPEASGGDGVGGARHGARPVGEGEAALLGGEDATASP